MGITLWEKEADMVKTGATSVYIKENKMNSMEIRQIVVVGAVAAILCIALLVGMFLILSSITGAHPSQTGIMLIAPSYIAPSHQFVDWKTVASPLL